MKLIRAILIFSLSVCIGNADRFVMRDNSVRVAKLVGMRNGTFLADVNGTISQIPVSDVSMLILENVGSQVRRGDETTGSGRSPQASAADISKNSSVDPIAPVTSSSSETVGGFRVDLDRCVKQGSKSVVCNFRVTNLQADRQMQIIAQGYYKESYYVDAQGNQRSAESVTFGGRGPAMVVTVTDVPTKGSLVFPGVESGVTSLAKLSIWMDLPGLHHTVEFRKIPLQGN